MKIVIGLIALALAACSDAPAQKSASEGMHVAHAKPAATPLDLDDHGLAALEAMTFDCPRAGLNAAAHAASKVPSQGSYQFSYFSIVNDAHHAAYEIHFTSNHLEEPALRYCVSMYCQQGWDPRKTQIDVRLMGDARRDACGLAGKKKR